MNYKLRLIISECGFEEDYNNNPYFRKAIDSISVEKFDIIALLQTIKTLTDIIVKQNNNLIKGVENASKT